MTRISEIIAPVYRQVHADIRAGGHREYWLKGGRGSGKSSFISIEIIFGMLRNPNAHAVIYRKVANTLRESVYEQMVKAIGYLGLRDFFACRLSPLEIRYKPTGQRIIFRGADDPSKSKSITTSSGYFGFLWFEELAEFGSMEDIRTIQASIIRGEGRAVTFMSYNPPQTANSWVNEEALTDAKNRMTVATTYLDMPESWLGEAFIEAAETLKQTNERAYRHMYLGEVTGTGGNVFDNVKVTHVSEEERRAFGETYCGLDFGWFPDPTAFVRCAYAPAQRKLIVYDEYMAVRTPNADIYAALTKEHGVTRNDEVICDSAEQKSVNDLRAFGMRAVGATKGQGSVRASVKWLQSLNEIVIDGASCPETAREFTKYEYEKTRDGRFCDTYPDRDNHFIDAVRYAMNRVWMRAGA